MFNHSNKRTEFFTEDEVRAIRQEYLSIAEPDYLASRRIAEGYGCSHKTVLKALRADGAYSHTQDRESIYCTFRLRAHYRRGADPSDKIAWIIMQRELGNRG